MMATQMAARSDEQPGEHEALVSPFGAATLAAESPAAATEYEDYAGAPMASPFAEAMAMADEGALEALSLEAVIAELEDETFDEAVQGLVDEAAARHLASSATWSSETEAPQLAEQEVEAWIGGVAAEADRLLERLETQFAGATYETFDEAFFEAEGARYITEAGVQSLATEQFLGKLVKKAKGLVKGAVNLAKKGIKAVGKILPIGKVFAALKKLVQPLLKRVLKMAIGKLPAALQPHARTLATKLFGKEAEAPYTGESSENELTEITEAFDTRLAEALLAPTEASVQQLVEEAEAEAEAQAASPDALAALDAARQKLARELQEASPGVSPVAEVEQFIPVVMAALPIIRIGIGIIGRDKVVRFIADKLAGLIKGHIGQQAAQALARPIVDIGLRMLTLEAESGEAPGVGAEAMVATLEDTVRTVAELPAEAFADPIRLEAETQEAFAAAAARHIPRGLLARRLPTIETSDGVGVWIYMPRATRPCYRYKKFNRVYQVPISQPTARAIRYPAGDTLERRLLDAGARVWPVQAEVHLYETLPGTQLGHLAAFESEQGASEASEAALEFETLTPEAAAMLVKEPGLGASPRGKRSRRLYRVSAAGLKVRRQKRFIVRLDTTGASPVARLHVRLSEREAHEAAAALGRKAHAQVVAQLRTTLGAAFRTALAARLTRHLAAKAEGTVPPERAAALAESMIGGALTALSAALPAAATTFAQAARDAASGVTLSFTFAFADKAALVTGTPAQPSLVIRPGWQRD